MYTLTLTRDERMAFDWVGYRYNAAHIAGILTESECIGLVHDWNDPIDITFDIPEHMAWGINKLAEKEDYSFPCFSDDLRDKLTAFCMSIV
jgi:hypothetical protein